MHRRDPRGNGPDQLPGVIDTDAQACVRGDALAPSRGRLAELSLQGLRQAQELSGRSVDDIALRLYRWNRLPTAAMRRIEAEPMRVRAIAARAAGVTWINDAPSQSSGPWSFWRPRGEPLKPTGRCWKVYVSPAPVHLAEAVYATLKAASGLPVVSLKYSADAAGMLRPDKLVVHLETFEAVVVLASRLIETLEGCPVHGVPFTAELGGDGLVSFGCDPPPGSDAASRGGSWRMWVTQTLALGLIAPRAASQEPWEHALDEARRAGVDPATWAPKGDLWATAGSMDQEGRE